MAAFLIYFLLFVATVESYFLRKKMAETSCAESDEIVEEMDVYLNGPVAGGNVLLLQCPEDVIPTETEEFPCKNGRIKPGHRVEFELDLPKAASSEHFDRSKSKHLATATENARKMFQFGECSKLTLATNLQCVSSIAPSALSINVGIVDQGALYLTPVNFTGTLGPSFSYMDTTAEPGPGVMSPPRPGAPTKPQAQAADTGGESSQDEGQGGAELQPVRARFARIESAEARQRRLATYEYFARKQAAQPWVNFTCHPAADPGSAEQKQFLTGGTSSTPSQPLPDSIGEKLLKALLPPPNADNVISGKQPEISMNMIRALPPCEQIRALLKNVKVLQYQQVVPLWPRSLPASQLLQTLQQYATLVQGCWVVKSEELYPPTSSSAVSGVPAENLINGRDFVLWCFTQSRWQMRKDIVPIIKLPIEDVKTILEQVAKPTARRGWEFLLPYDHDFVTRHVEVAQRQASAWTARFEALQSVYKIPRDWEKRAKAAASAAAAESAAAAAASGNTPPKRKRSKSRSSISLM